MVRTAILIDGAFFIRRYRSVYPDRLPLQPDKVAADLFTMCVAHLKPKPNQSIQPTQLYRIFYYDCHPSDKRVHHPLNGQSIHFARTEVYRFQTEFFRQLSKKRKVALRFGRLADGTAGWQLTSRATKDLLSRKRSIDDLVDNDVRYDIKQKGVDMRLGLDVASLAYKGLVDQIVLVAGDADFVPATRLARREGIDVVLDPMWQPVGDDLYLHIDGLRSTCPRPTVADGREQEPSDS